MALVQYEAQTVIGGHTCEVWVMDGELCFTVDGSFDVVKEPDREIRRRISNWFKYQLVVELPLSMPGQEVVAYPWAEDGNYEKRVAFFRSLPGWVETQPGEFRAMF